MQRMRAALPRGRSVAWSRQEDAGKSAKAPASGGTESHLSDLEKVTVKL